MAVVPPRPAASVIVLRPGDPFDVLMVERNGRGMFGGLMVFPGGAVDQVDWAHDRSGEDGHRAAALRELAEETGLLALADGVRLQPPGIDLYSWLEDERLDLALDSLVLISRWVTPEMAPSRFDTVFYLLPVTTTPDVRVDETELRGSHWVAPLEALRSHRSGSWKMILPTLAHLRWLARRRSITDALESARGADGRTLIRPAVAGDGSLLPVLLPAT